MQFLLLLFVIGGLGLAAAFGVTGVQNEQAYTLGVGTLLAIGLYSATYGISLQEARTHMNIIVRAVTVGVFLKALIIGGLVSIALGDPFGFVLGVAVAQIDPLSTAALMKHGRLSKKAQAVLHSWASFDDPMTVILSVYVPALLAIVFGASWQVVQTTDLPNLSGYIGDVALNFLFAGVAFALWQAVRRFRRTSHFGATILVAGMAMLVFIGAIVVGIWQFWMLGIALVGLFIRPAVDGVIDKLLHWAVSLAAVLLGVVLLDGVNILGGLALGVAAYAAQVLVGLLLTRKMSRQDQLHIAFAQQNGITAIILALLFEVHHPGTVAIVAPAILVINILHFFCNELLDGHLQQDMRRFGASHHLGNLRVWLKKL